MVYVSALEARELAERKRIRDQRAAEKPAKIEEPPAKLDAPPAKPRHRRVRGPRLPPSPTPEHKAPVATYEARRARGAQLVAQQGAAWLLPELRRRPDMSVRACAEVMKPYLIAAGVDPRCSAQALGIGRAMRAATAQIKSEKRAKAQVKKDAKVAEREASAPRRAAYRIRRQEGKERRLRAAAVRLQAKREGEENARIAREKATQQAERQRIMRMQEREKAQQQAQAQQAKRTLEWEKVVATWDAWVLECAICFLRHRASLTDVEMERMLEAQARTRHRRLPPEVRARVPLLFPQARRIVKSL